MEEEDAVLSLQAEIPCASERREKGDYTQELRRWIWRRKEMNFLYSEAVLTSSGKGVWFHYLYLLLLPFPPPPFAPRLPSLCPPIS